MSQTFGLLEYGDYRSWESHHFGLPAGRWAALAEQVVWVTGAGSGFGAAIATILAAAGARPVLSGRRRDRLEAVRDGMRAMGADPGRALVVPCDVTQERELEAAVRRIEAEAAPLNGLVISAALPQLRTSDWPLADLPLKRWQEMVDTNVTAPWLTARTSLPSMLRGQAARIVLLTSEAGWASTAGFGPYNVSKAALNALGTSLAEETAAAHPLADIQINILNPGEARTQMNQGSEVSPYAAVAMTIALLSHPSGGPNGRLFARDGRHLAFACALPWDRPLA
jgi:NAD(P)-dependent dehydrogenase (short-subunit alcohol dehydrogenase family)